jgi:hypothetical protein
MAIKIFTFLQGHRMTGFVISKPHCLNAYKIKKRGLTMLRKYFIIILITLLGVFLINGCATLPEHFDRPFSYAFTDTDSTRLGTIRRDEMRANPEQSGFLLLGDGKDAFVARCGRWKRTHFLRRSLHELLETFRYRIYEYSAHRITTVNHLLQKNNSATRDQIL